nr:DUF899 family protein [Asticcacaulis biprosthecium]
MHGIWTHLENHDVKFACVSRAPLAKLMAFRARMGWDFDWVSAGDGDFNYDFHVSFRQDEPVYYNYADRDFECEDLPGMSVFRKAADGTIYHTYSVFSRGTELASGVFQLLDMTPNGRNETGPNGDLTDWVKHHDKYDGGASSCGCGGKTA